MWAALFPGQGSQHPGMGRFLYDEFTLTKRLFEEASDVLSINFKKLCFDGAESDLAMTENTQPCLLLVSTAGFQVLKTEFGFAPKVAAGHSVGEYAAVVAAEAMSFTDGMIAVRKRGQAMQEAVPLGRGGMSAVMGLEPKQVFELCAWAEKETGDTPVSPANINAPGQIVISGKKTILDWIATNYKAEMFGGARVKFIPLKVSAPFHCAMMKPAEMVMADVLKSMPFSQAKFPVVQNVNAEPESSPKTLVENLVKQVTAPVRWIECVQKIQHMGGDKAIEIGSGKVIAGLVKKIAGDTLPVSNINSLEELKAVGAQLEGG